MKKTTAMLIMAVLVLAILGGCKTNVKPSPSASIPVVSETPKASSPAVSQSPAASATVKPTASPATSPKASK